MDISSKSKFIALEGKTKILFLLSKVMVTVARFCLLKFFEPLKIRSEPPLPRSDFMDCSPKTKRTASTTFDLPEPFGPTIEVILGSNSKVLFLANDLKPLISKVLRYILFFLPLFYL